VKREIPFAIVISFLLIFLVNENILWKENELWFIDWVILLLFFIWFLYYTYTISKNKSWNGEDFEIKDYTKLKSSILIILWLIWLTFWWELIVSNAVKIAEYFGLSQAFIWVTIVAIWTSLPELASSVVAAIKKNTDMAIWTVLWSNIFNILWILWFSSLFNNLVWYDTLNVDLVIWSFLNVLILVFAFIHRKNFLDKKEWVILLLVYLLYTIYLIYNL
jgi:cation:H+ antiporter